MEGSFGNSANFVLPETQKILAQCPKVRKVLFLPEFCPLESSTGRVQGLTDEPGVFLQIRFSSEKPSKDIKLYLPPNKDLPKKFLWSRGFCFGHPCRKLLPQIRNFFILNQKRMSEIFFSEKNPFVSKHFSGDMECGVDNSGKKVSPRNRQLLAHFPKVKEFWFLPKLFPGSAPLCWTRRKPSWFVQFFFWSFCGPEGCRLDAAGVSVF